MWLMTIFGRHLLPSLVFRLVALLPTGDIRERGGGTGAPSAPESIKSGGVSC